jgi:hypothetical protein
MNLSKSQALLLSKILFSHAHVYPDMFNQDCLDLLHALNRFLVDDGSLNKSMVDEDDDEDEDDEDGTDEDDDEGVEPPEVEDTVTYDELHELPAVTSAEGELEFESPEEDALDLLLAGAVVHEGVEFLKREDKTLEVWVNEGDALSLHQYTVKRFPKAWTKLLKTGVVYGLDG